MTRLAKHTPRLAAALALLCALASQTLASPPLVLTNLSHAEGDAAGQQSADKPAGKSALKPRVAGQTKGKSAAQTREERERRQAVALLVETADAARSFEDLAARAEVQALAADALWPHDEQTARAVFMRAWEAAGDADRATWREDAEEEPGAEDGAAASIRLELLPIAAKRDAKLVERLVKQLQDEETRPEAVEESSREAAATDEGGARGDGQSSSRRRSPWGELNPKDAWRFDMAGALLQEGEPERAAQLAAPLVAGGPSAQLLMLLRDLRALHTGAADELYRRLLERTLSDQQADANDVLLLSSYVVSPDLLVVVDEQGSTQFRSLALGSAAEEKKGRAVLTNVRALFYRTAAAVLTRTTGASAAQGNNVGLFFAVERLLPFFERDAPQYAPALHARRAALAAEIDAARRERLGAQAATHSLTAKNSTDPLREWLERVERSGDDDAGRDPARFAAVKAAARLKLWDRARNLAGEIKDEDLRGDARTVILYRQVLSVGEGFREDEDESDWARADAFVHAADVPPLVRAFGLAQVAELAARRGKHERAAELLKEGAAAAEQADANTDGRHAAFAALTVAAARTRAAQVWELLAATVREANGVEKYSELRRPPTVAVNAQREGTESLLVLVDEPLLPEDVFAQVARLDFALALAEARTLKDAAGRAHAQIAVARARLEGGAEVRRGVEKQ